MGNRVGRCHAVAKSIRGHDRGVPVVGRGPLSHDLLVVLETIFMAAPVRYVALEKSDLRQSSVANGRLDRYGRRVRGVVISAITQARAVGILVVYVARVPVLLSGEGCGFECVQGGFFVPVGVLTGSLTRVSTGMTCGSVRKTNETGGSRSEGCGLGCQNRLRL